jgi:glutathione synthase/RimK-type ligase-like ATP-grasp enzyme
MQRYVALVSFKRDPHTREVRTILKREKQPFIELNSDEFGQALEIGYGVCNTSYSIRISHKQKSIPLTKIKSIFFRKPHLWFVDPYKLTKQQCANLNFKRSEASNYLVELVDIAESCGCFVVDNPSRCRSASNKLAQLMLARDIGLSIPETIITADEKKIKKFIGRKTRVTKRIAQQASSISRNVRPYFTREIDRTIYKKYTAENDIDYPILLQEKIEKSLELRIVVVGEKVFCCSIDSQVNEKAKIDFRVVSPYSLPHEQYSLPKDIEKKCLALTKSLKLNFSAIDMAVTPNNKYVFFELNPAGQYLWLEKLAQIPISEAIAEMLIRASAS